MPISGEETFLSLETRRLPEQRPSENYSSETVEECTFQQTLTLFHSHRDHQKKTSTVNINSYTLSSCENG